MMRCARLHTAYRGKRPPMPFTCLQCLKLWIPTRATPVKSFCLPDGHPLYPSLVAPYRAPYVSAQRAMVWILNDLPPTTGPNTSDGMQGLSTRAKGGGCRWTDSHRECYAAIHLSAALSSCTIKIGRPRQGLPDSPNGAGAKTIYRLTTTRSDLSPSRATSRTRYTPFAQSRTSTATWSAPRTACACCSTPRRL